MSSNVLSGIRVVVWAESEVIRTEAYATLSIEGWQADALFPESLQEFEHEITHDISGTLVVIVDSDGNGVQKLVSGLFKLEYSPKQLVIGCPKNSFIHRLLGRHEVELFPYEYKRTPTGPKVEISGLISSLLRAWKNVSVLLLDREVKEAVSSGFLACMKVIAKLPSTGLLKERAHLAHALAEHINNNHMFRQRVIRLALCTDLVHVHEHDEIIAERRALWPIKDLLKFNTDLLDRMAGKMAGRAANEAESWPADMPLEVVVVKTAQLFQNFSETELSADNFSQSLAKLTRTLPLEIRVGVKNASAATFGHLLVRKSHVA